jgi:uncharacterized protein
MIYLFSLLLLFNTARADIHLPELTSPVVDEAGMLSASDQRAIEQWIYDYKRQGKAQLQVAIVKDLQGLSIEEYSVKLADKWKLGNQKRDDGVLFLISAGDKQMRIEVGQGLEGALTDLRSKRILEDRVKPLFRSGQFGPGIAAGVSEIVAAVDPEYVNAQPEQAWEAQDSGWGDRIWIILVVLFIFLNIFGRFFGLGRRRRYYPGFYGGGLFGGGGFGGGGFGGGSSGGGWSGGGGGFSGGGASSNW